MALLSHTLNTIQSVCSQLQLWVTVVGNLYLSDQIFAL